MQVLLVCEVCFVPASSEQIKAFSTMTTPKQTYFVGWVMKGVPSLLWGVVWDSTARPVPELSVIFGKSRVWVHSLIARVFTQGFLNIMKLVPLFEAMVMCLLRPVLQHTHISCQSNAPLTRNTFILRCYTTEMGWFGFAVAFFWGWFLRWCYQYCYS